MQVASLDNCKKLFELSGWNVNTDYWWYDDQKTNTQFIDKNPSEYQINEPIVPAYYLGYLIRKLPKFISLGQIISSDSPWVASCTKFHPNKHPYCAADTPEDALALLAIKLLEKGILKK